MIPQPKLTWTLRITSPTSVLPGKRDIIPQSDTFIVDSWEDLQVELAKWEHLAAQNHWAVAMSISVEMTPILLVVGPGAPPGGTLESPEPRRWPMPIDQVHMLLCKGCERCGRAPQGLQP